MNNAIIGIGSNINPQSNILVALRKVEQYFTIHKQSSLIKTKPIGFRSQPDFINGVIHIRTNNSQDEVVQRLKSIEIEMGRVRSGNKYGPRVIDLDLLIWNNVIIDDEVNSIKFL